MEGQKEFILADERAFYLIKHFEELDKKGHIYFKNLGYSDEKVNHELKTIGSKFYTSFCDNPFDLIQKITHYIPFDIINQTNGNKAFIYKIPFTGGIGTNTIIPLKDIRQSDKSKIKKVIRNGFHVNVLEQNFFDFTNQLVVICNSLNEIITVFPGIYAPAYPTQLVDEQELKASILFWENHAFIKNSIL
jgi:hypothetical protein